MLQKKWQHCLECRWIGFYNVYFGLACLEMKIMPFKDFRHGTLFHVNMNECSTISTMYIYDGATTNIPMFQIELGTSHLYQSYNHIAFALLENLRKSVKIPVVLWENHCIFSRVVNSSISISGKYVIYIDIEVLCRPSTSSKTLLLHDAC